jgi:hypothetical protein
MGDRKMRSGGGRKQNDGSRIIGRKVKGQFDLSVSLLVFLPLIFLSAPLPVTERVAKK